MTDHLIVTDNVSLPNCEAENLRDRLVDEEGWDGDWNITGNDFMGTCE